MTSYTVVNARGRTVLPASDAATAAIVSCCLFATAAHADVMGAIPRGPDGMGGDFPADASPGTTQTWQVNLEAGKDFAFVAAFDGYGAVILRNASGQAVMSFQVTPYNEDYWFGHEFRAAYTGAYFLDLTAGPETAGYGAGWYWLAYQYDCPGGRRTACTLPVGTSRKSYVTFPYEWDWWKTTLKAGKRYDITTNESLRVAFPAACGVACSRQRARRLVCRPAGGARRLFLGPVVASLAARGVTGGDEPLRP